MPAGVLLVTAEPGLAGQVRRLCALAGGGCDIERDSGVVRAAWRQAPVVLVGADLVVAVAAAGLPRRERVFVVSDGALDASCWNAALSLGARRVLTLPADQSALVEEARAADRPSNSRGRLVGVIGGCGGAGASTFAASLALSAPESDSTLLLDGDPLGGGLDLLLGAEGVPGLRWRDLASTSGALDPCAFAGALSHVAGIAVLAWGPGSRAAPTPAPALRAEAVDAVVDAASRAFSTIVVDLGRRLDAYVGQLADALDVTILVVPAEVRAVAAAACLLDAIGARLATPHLVVRECGGGLSARDVAASLGLEPIGQLREDGAVKAAGQRGELPVRRGRGAYAQACESIWANLPVPAMSQ
ncbi:MAG TPA: septum site-determining protein Ssd [Mycobacteriales bacterium]|jgi:secretion/DNA translocation related CpaE-like protein|nr:septum site-determining protein Ssd [Mycobacteriales bacterium]